MRLITSTYSLKLKNKLKVYVNNNWEGTHVHINVLYSSGQ